MKLCKALSIFALTVIPASAWAQGTITSGPATYAVSASHFDASPSANFTGVGTGDYVFEAGWFFRIEGDASETFFPVPDTQNYTGNTATLTWANTGGRNFSATKVHVVTDAAGPAGEVVTTMTVTNNSGAPITLHLFHAIDWDVNGSAGTDTGILVSPGYVRVNDTTAGQAESRGSNAVSAIARAFSGTTDVFALLADASVTNFDNSGLPFAAADITLGLQWTFTLAPGASDTARLFSAANLTATPVQLQQFEIE